MPRFDIHHITKYTYDGPVRDSASQVLLFPIKDEYQELLKQELTITGDPVLDKYKDYYENEVGSFSNAEPHSSLVIDSNIEVITRPRPLPRDQTTADDQWKYLQQIRWEVQYIDFLKQEHFDRLQELLDNAGLDQAGSRTPLEASEQLRSYVFDNFQYIKGVTSVESTLDEVWNLKAGVCQDFAHILLVLLRQIHIPARYVSGYICPNQNGMRGEGATHAWIEAYIPMNGWVGFDPTNNCIVEDKHVRLAVGRNFSDCSPVKGTYKGTASHILEVGVSVSYENGKTMEETATILTPQPVKNGVEQNSYRIYMEMMQQQQ
jgi:transglutaminase-like putative cysteine protease